MKILLFGSKGMAGHMIESYLSQKNYLVHGISREEIDIENTDDTTLFLKNRYKNYSFIINCTGVLVQDSIDQPNRAVLVNSWFPRYLENITANSKTKVIHISTDCIFDGMVGNYTEDSNPSEKNFYGKTKALGELTNLKDITFRTSIIGPELKSTPSGLFEWIRKNSSNDIPGWENVYWTGLTTLQLAKCVEIYINNPKVTGIYHLVNNTKINKYSLLNIINEHFMLGKNIIKTKSPKSLDKSLVDTRKCVDFRIPSYDDMIKELYTYIN